MARSLRENSPTGYFHLIVRGNNKQIPFEEEQDYRFFLTRLGKCSREEKDTINAHTWIREV